MEMSAADKTLLLLEDEGFLSPKRWSTTLEVLYETV